MKKIEIILILLTLLGAALSLAPLPGGNMLTILAGMLLSMLYFYLGFALFNDIRLRYIFKKSSYKDISTLRILGAIATGLQLSLVVIGLIFKFMLWHGGGFMLFIAGAGLVIVVLVSLVKYSLGKQAFYSVILKRAVPFTLLSILFLWLYDSTWQRIRHRENQEYVKALKELDEKPEDEAARQKVKEIEAGFRKMEGAE